MPLERDLTARSGGACELCGSSEGVNAYEVKPSDGTADKAVHLCATCKGQIESNELDETHFNCLNDAMWSQVPAVQVLAYRLLNQLGRQDLVEMMYLEDDVKTWAEAGMNSGDAVVHKDCNGVVLQAGDTVVIMKDLEVKGAGFTAKRGTAVRNISLPQDDADHIEGRVNGTKIFILTQYLKKQ